MGVSYEKYRIILAKYKLKPTDIQKATNLSWGALTNINNDKYVNVNTLETIAHFLSKITGKRHDIGDLVSIYDDEN